MRKLWSRLIVLAIATGVLMVVSTSAFAQDAAPTAADLTTIKVSIDTVWVMLTGFLVFFMQTGFAMLEAGLIRQKAVVNALLENFIDAGLTAICWWVVGFGIAFGATSGGLFGTTLFMPGVAEMSAPFGTLNISVLTMFFFQFAFAATASTITTGAMAERTDFIGDLIYSAIIAIAIYPVIVHWVWGGGWLGANLGFYDFAGSTVVHTVGGVIALIGAIMLGARSGREFGSPPKPHNLALATLGTMILWFGWFGFNPGSTLGAYGQGSLIGLVTLNTTLGAAAGGLATMFFIFFRTGKWDLVYTLNGTLAGLVAITAGCAFVSPTSGILIGLIAGILVVLATDLIEMLKIDDAVGAFPVHGVCGIWGTIAIGLFADSTLTTFGANAGKAGVLMGGGFEILGVQVVGSLATIAYVSVASVLMFGLLKVINRLRVNKKADIIGIDVYEHGASIWPDVLPFPEDVPAGGETKGATAPAAGD
ncbi:MAG: ammonium transporter [Anaerolineae bacterium]|jgi:Amt family ammonium transporter|nr:ammonium transporter [Anaerolineae bacterium]